MVMPRLTKPVVLISGNVFHYNSNSCCFGLLNFLNNHRKIMALKPQAELTERDLNRGLVMVIWDGLASEVVTSLTGGAFLVAMALLLGANNVQIGLLAALPTITNIFQLLSIVLVRKYQNRRAISVFCIAMARIPLAIIGVLVLLSDGGSINMLIFFLFFHFFFSSVSGLSWNSWMKDMIPAKMLGEYFSRRSRYTQTLNVVLSIVLALLLDYIRSRYPAYELTTFAAFFIIAGVVGVIGAYLLSRAPEPQSYLSKAKLINLLRMPLKNENFRRLLVFNSAWVFALTIATPFFTVFMLQGMGLPLSYIIVLTIISQLCSIMTLRMWGVFSDRYSNKSIIAISAPLYIVCIIGWSFVGIYPLCEPGTAGSYSYLQWGVYRGNQPFSNQYWSEACPKRRCNCIPLGKKHCYGRFFFPRPSGRWCTGRLLF